MGAAGIAGAGLGAAQFLTAKQSADAIEQQSRFEAQTLQFQSEMALVQRREILKKSQDDIELRQQDTAKLIGTQRVNLAAQGIDIESGTAAELQIQAEEIGARDVATISNNAWRQAWGIQVQSQTLASEADFTRLSGTSRARTTFLSGAIQGGSTAVGGFRRG